MKKKLGLFSLNEKAMKETKAGGVRGCGCNYADSGGSSIADNGYVNSGGDLWSPDGIVIVVIY
jgi:hypothetical protein